MVCRTGFEPVNHYGTVLQTAYFDHLHTDTYGISGRIRACDIIRMKDAYWTAIRLRYEEALRLMVLPVGVEPTTHGASNRCSTS